MIVYFQVKKYCVIIMAENKNVKSEINIAEPAALGLTGLGVAAFVLASVDLELTSTTLKSLVIPWVLFFGATAQLIAGTIDFKRNNIFGGTVFTTYSMAMFAIASTLIITNILNVNVDVHHYGYGLIAILIFTAIATIVSLLANKLFFAILVTVDIALIILILHALQGTSAFIGGIFLLITSMLSFYGVTAILINTMTGKTILPMGKPLWKP